MRLTALVASATAALVIAVGSPASGQTGVTDSVHNFTGPNAGTSEIGTCTFCHTPHRGLSSRLAWNKKLSTNTHSWTEGATGGGTPFPTIDPGWSGASKFCLSCHDGSQPIGAVAWFNKQSWLNNPIDNTDHDGDKVQMGTATGDLTGLHPFAAPVPFNGVGSTYNGVSTGAAALASGWQPDPTVDGIRLFNEFGGLVTAGASAGSTGIECSSCHDPHNGPGVEDAFLLRGSTDVRDPNYICTKCHAAMGDYQADPALHPHP